jgi:phage shock protein C
LDIERSTRDRWIRGVCGGIAHAYGWDSNVVRIVAVVLTLIVPGLSTVLALAVYLVLGFVLPESEEF